MILLPLFLFGDGPRKKNHRDSAAEAVDSMIINEQVQRTIQKHELVVEVTQIESDLDSIIAILKADTLSGY